MIFALDDYQGESLRNTMTRPKSRKTSSVCLELTRRVPFSVEVSQSWIHHPGTTNSCRDHRISAYRSDSGSANYYTLCRADGAAQGTWDITSRPLACVPSPSSRLLLTSFCPSPRTIYFTPISSLVDPIGGYTPCPPLINRDLIIGSLPAT